VPDYFAHIINSTHPVTYRPLIGVSLFLLMMSVTYFKRMIQRRGQLSPYIQLGSLGLSLQWDCDAISDFATIYSCVPSTCAQNAILCIPIIPIIPSRQISVAIDNPLLVPSIPRLTSSSYLWNYVCAAHDIFTADNLQSNRCQCCSHLYKFGDGIQVTQVIGYCGEHQG
jgi:hypothetical protein